MNYAPEKRPPPDKTGKAQYGSFRYVWNSALNRHVVVPHTEGKNK